MGVNIIGNKNALGGSKNLNYEEVLLSEINFNKSSCNKSNTDRCNKNTLNMLHNYKGVKSNKTVRIIKNGKYSTNKIVDCSVDDRLKLMEFADLMRIYGIEYGENCKEKDVLELVLYSEECVGIWKTKY